MNHEERKMKSSKSAGVLTVIGLAVLGYGVVAYASDAQVQKQPVVTMEQARAAATKAFPGTIDEVDLEREHGGSGLRYSFDMHRDGHYREVGIDARSGKVLENRAQESDRED
jgi:uncharacterized membrane protein YkoI